MPCGPRSPSSCGRSNARATSWRWWPMKGSRCSAGSTPCPRRASCRNIPRASPRTRLLGLWHDQVTGEALVTGESLNLDFHSVPYFGAHPLVESHYLSMRSRRQPSILTFLAQDADSQVFCYSNADIRKGEEAEEVFRFIAFWKRQYGSLPRHLVFDSKLTTYDGLDRLDAAGITFITLRRRSPSLLAEIDRLPPSAWRTVTLDISSRKHRTPRVYEHKVRPHKRDFRQFSSLISATTSPPSCSPMT